MSFQCKEWKWMQTPPPPSLAQKLFPVESHSKIKNVFSLTESHLRYNSLFFFLQNIFIVKSHLRSTMQRLSQDISPWFLNFQVPISISLVFMVLSNMLLTAFICCFETNTNPSDSKTNQNKRQEQSP